MPLACRLPSTAGDKPGKQQSDADFDARATHEFTSGSSDAEATAHTAISAAGRLCLGASCRGKEAAAALLLTTGVLYRYDTDADARPSAAPRAFRADSKAPSIAA